ncbi:MAG: glycosyltransferase [Opitutales bacterium]
MRVVILQDFLRSGGTEAQTLFLGKLLQDAGQTVHLLTARPGGRLAGRAADLGLTHESLTRRDWRINRFPRRRLGVRLKALQPGLLILMGRTANEAGAWLAKHLPALPRIATVRTGRPFTSPYRAGLRSARVVIVNSRYAEARVRRLDVSENRIQVIRNPLVRLFDPAGRADRRDRCRQAVGTPPETPVLIKIAAFRPGKNHQGLLAILSGLQTDPAWELWLLGEGRERRRCERIARRYGLADRVRFLGYQADPVPYYEAADVACLTSLEESLPNFLIEAQAAGLPVVAYDVAGVGECFADGRSGLLVRPADTTGYRRALVQLLENPERRRSFAAVGPAFVREHFSPERQADQYRQALAPWLNGDGKASRQARAEEGCRRCPCDDHGPPDRQ